MSVIGETIVSSSLFTASILVFRRYLRQLGSLLDTAQAQSGIDGTATMLDTRLAPDMLPLRVQVEVVCNFALRASFPLAGQPVPDYGHFSNDVDGLRARMQNTLALLDTLSPEHFARAAERTIHDRAGEADLALPASEFLFEYALPNFFFHFSAAYMILRSHGIVIGKADFDGYHVYSSHG